MPFIPHTDEEIHSMLDTIGASSIEDLFDEIPAVLRCGDLAKIPDGLTELEVSQLIQGLAAQDGQPHNFIGAGAYHHHIPAAVWQIATRGEFYSAYTPYQAEASQGTLQLLYEFQSMMTALTGMEVSNASLYDAASGLGEAVLMAVRANRKSKSKKILLPRTVHPNYRKTAHNITHAQGVELVDIAYSSEVGTTLPETFAEFEGEDIAAIVIQQPNFFGVLEDVDALTNWAHAQGALVIAVVNPVSLGLLNAPGDWGDTGADIVIGEGQPLGIPLSSGGPYFGFMCTRKSLVRQMPGRIAARTTDLDGKEGYTLTLQAREQHIRRSKATSNICTNQGLMVTAATIHMAIMGATGLKTVATNSHINTQQIASSLTEAAAVSKKFSGEFFHEVVLSVDDMSVTELQKTLAEDNILAGYYLGDDYPELADSLLLCSTEVHSAQALALLDEKFKQAVAS